MKPLLHASITGKTKHTDPEPLLYDLYALFQLLYQSLEICSICIHLFFFNLYLVDFVHLDLNKVPS